MACKLTKQDVTNQLQKDIDDKKLKSEKGRILSKIKINLNENDYL